MSLTSKGWARALDAYWAEIERRPADVIARERQYPVLAEFYGDNQPPHFEREDIRFIVEWKYTDKRRCKRALDGLESVSAVRIREATAAFADLDDPSAALDCLTGLVHGIGVAGVSAVLAAARPSLFPVIDVFAVIALEHHYPAPWITALPRDDHGRPQPRDDCYPKFTAFCRATALTLSRDSGRDWTPRMVDMALWATGKELADAAGS
ncbi:MAG: hypothetical protein ACT4PU_11975 [Planctomycetota bacterium]